MTTKMTRRTFLKGAAAAAAAVSLSGLLTGCGGDQLADNEVQIGPFIVKVYGLDVNLGTASGNDKGAITGKVKLRYDAGGSSWQGGSYNNMFKAVVVDANLTQVAPTGPFFVSDALVGKPFATEEKDLKLSFPTDEARQNFLDGKPAVMTITINGMTGVLFLMKRDDNSLLPPRRSADRIKNPLPRALWKECPGLFVVLPRGRRMVLGSFSGNVKKCATVFTVSLQAPCKSPARPPKFYLHFARVWSQPPAGMRYNKAVPKEAQ